MPYKNLSDAQVAKLTKRFKRIDKDNSNSLTVDDLDIIFAFIEKLPEDKKDKKKAATDAKNKMKQELIDADKKENGGNGNGQVSLEEFLNAADRAQMVDESED